MEAQAFLTSLHFITAELVVSVDLCQEKVHRKILKRKHSMIEKTKVPLFIGYKVKLKFLFLYFIVFICKFYKGQAKKYYNAS